MTLNFGEKKPVNEQVGVGKVKLYLLRENVNILVQAMEETERLNSPVSLLPLGHRSSLGM